jgi:hypothetical protein
MASKGLRPLPLPTVSWRVIGNHRCVALSATEDLLSDTAAIREDIRAEIAESCRLIAEANRLIAEARGEGKRAGWLQPEYAPDLRADNRNADSRFD